jgi:hypothetical protein
MKRETPFNPEPDLEALYLSCDQCDAIFDANDEAQGRESQRGHDGPHGYVPSLCPECLKGAQS